MGNSNSKREQLSLRIEMLEKRNHLRREMERCKDSLQSMRNKRSELKIELEELGAENGQNDAVTQGRSGAIESELADLNRHIAKEERQLDVLNSRLAELRAQAIGC
jgi:chromosome segregation ATPase